MTSINKKGKWKIKIQTVLSEIYCLISFKAEIL